MKKNEYFLRFYMTHFENFVKFSKCSKLKIRYISENVEKFFDF